MNDVLLSNLILAVGAALVVVGTVSSRIATRFGAPILLVFLMIGVGAGEDGLGIQFSNYWATYMVGSAALAVILFDGGLRMRASSMRGAVGPAVLLATFGVLLTAVLVAVPACLVLGMSPLQGLLTGAIVASTDAAAVFFLVREQGLRLGRRVGSVIEIESATNDPAAVFLTVLVVELLSASGAASGWMVLSELVQQLAVGAVAGGAAGLALAAFLNRVHLPGGLQPVMVVASAVTIFALTALLHGSGFLAVYLAGFVLGNRPVRGIASITSFHDAVTWLCQIVMFVMLGLLVSPHRVLDILLPSLVIAAFLILVARPATVFLCLAPFGFQHKEKVFISWAGLRGAVSIFLATIPMLAHLPGAEVYFNVAFVVVITSLLLHGWTLVASARKLDVALSGPQREPQRFEIDLPGQSEHELVGYPINTDTLTLSPGLLPPWARMVLVVRAGKVFDPPEAGALVAGDYVYVLAPPQRVRQLDRQFMVEEFQWGVGPAFPFAGDVRLGDVADLYGLAVTDADRTLSIADAFADRSDDRPAPGMRIALGHAAIEVRKVEDGRVTQAALRFEEAGDQEEAGPWGMMRRFAHGLIPRTK